MCRSGARTVGGSAWDQWPMYAACAWEQTAGNSLMLLRCTGVLGCLSCKKNVNNNNSVSKTSARCTQDALLLTRRRKNNATRNIFHVHDDIKM